MPQKVVSYRLRDSTVSSNTEAGMLCGVATYVTDEWSPERDPATLTAWEPDFGMVPTAMNRGPFAEPRHPRCRCEFHQGESR